MRTALSLLLILGSTSICEAAMNDRTLDGEILDARIRRCGVRVETDAMATLRPFIEASASVSGRMDLRVEKRSASGTSASSQSSGFSGGQLPAIRMGVDRPAEIAVRLEVSDGAGTLLCRLDTEVTV